MVLVAAVLVQISIGVATVHFGVPLAAATLHNAGAAFLVGTMIWLMRALWPGPPMGMVPLNRVDRPE
jgi:heme A synthase